MESKVKIKGMSCNHCVMAVNKSLKNIEGVEDVQVNLEQGEAVIQHSGNLDMNKVRNEIEKAGYEIG